MVLDESDRLDAKAAADWRKWGPYISGRQWGTVREDYSPNGDAWSYTTHDLSRSFAYRWGEDGIGGFCDVNQYLCLAPAFWNGKDSIIKERLFGLSNLEGNHGEDVKELYYYLDGCPSHAYMRMLYKYPQRVFPYEKLVNENEKRTRQDREFDLMDSGIFDDDCYFDIFIEYAKAGPEDILLRIEAFNRGPEMSSLHIIPQIWFRNIWSWNPAVTKPRLQEDANGVTASHSILGKYFLYFDESPDRLFCDNESNERRVYNDSSYQGYPKDGINDAVISGNKSFTNPEKRGTKCGLVYSFEVASGGSAAARVRLSNQMRPLPFDDFQESFAQRKGETDFFYGELQKHLESPDARLVQRQAFAGMLWTKQFYFFDVPQWLRGDPGEPPPPPERVHGRNSEWQELNNADVISMPDKWEYPWYASWDLAFHCITLALIDPEYAKSQLVLLTREWYMHPNGQLPAYEWNFSDVNPPVHAWSAWRVFQMDRKRHNGKGDISFLERVFHKMLLNFTWWVNRKDASGRNVFQGGFLGLDNIGVFDRSAPLPNGVYLDQADGTSWMAMYCLNMMRIALELALHNPVYQDLATKFFEHFLYIAEAMTSKCGNGCGLWDEEDQFYYDMLRSPGGVAVPLRVRSLVGLIPLFAVETLEPELLAKVPEFNERLEWFLDYRPDLAALVSRWKEPGRGERRLLSLLRGHRMKMLLGRMLDENEFLSPFGVRSLSRYHLEHPYSFEGDGSTLEVRYEPAESDSGMFGGNSNWRGPIWMPVNYLIIESLQRFYHYYGEDFRIEYPAGSGEFFSIEDVSRKLTRRLMGLFLKNENGKRIMLGKNEKLQRDPHFCDYLIFPEYFNGDTGEGLGASHQTGWTGLIAKLLHPRAQDK